MLARVGAGFKYSQIFKTQLDKIGPDRANLTTTHSVIKYMIKKWLFGLSLVVLSLPLQNCQSNALEDVDNNCIRVKVLAYICAEAVFQILDPAYYHLGEKNWTSDDSKFDHVFHSFLRCSDIEYLGGLPSGTAPGTVLHVKLTDGNGDNNCAVCKATLGNAPKTKLNIQFQLQGCE